MVSITMFAFASRFYRPSDACGAHRIGPSNVPDTHGNAAYFLDLASSYTEEALKDCGDESPPLCILQAFIITAHCQLTQGVLGTAWRTLGTCVRLAYELNLHLIDMKCADRSPGIDAKTWCEDEEKRRAWWAIWEMDVFATTIRRTPTAIDWSQTETMLPAEDEYWFQGRVGPSCYLEMDPISRWRTLQNSRNQSPKAWYIVINSFMKDAQKISSPHGIPSQNQAPDGQLAGATPQAQSAVIDHARQKLESLGNIVQCFSLALPSHLRYRNQYLGFDARVPGQSASARQLHCSIYNIYVMTQLAKLMIHRYNVFGNAASHSGRKTRRAMSALAEKEWGRSNNRLDDIAMRQYLEAADNILTIVNRSCDDHIQHINPFLSFTIWLASAVQLVRRGFCHPGASQSLVKSKFEVLNLTYKQCIEFWDIKPAVQQNLEALEAQLEACQTRNSGVQPASGPAAYGVDKVAPGPHLDEEDTAMFASRDTFKEPRGLDSESRKCII
ncbi:hypothetical protein NW754_004540 [Fusarium falciforme]|nr:hypothetical protein NW754_004540 [Fusarium falciforme]